MWEELIHTEERDGFTIKFYACEEHASIDQCFETSDVEAYKADVESGKLVWFMAKVTASKCGVELAREYLGGCMYDNYKDFINPDCYYGDMFHQVIEEAKETIKELTA